MWQSAQKNKNLPIIPAEGVVFRVFWPITPIDGVGEDDVFSKFVNGAV